MEEFISIVIPVWNGEAFLSGCIHSLQQLTKMPHEIIVVDNGSRDESRGLVDTLTKEISSIHIIGLACNMGFAYAVNRGMIAARGDIVFLLNQDTVALTEWDRPVINRFRQDKQIGIVGCKLFYPDGQVQHAGGQLIEPLWNAQHITKSAEDTRIDYVTGAAFAIRRSCMTEIGLFDERFQPAYYEDVDYCLRAKAKGWHVVLEPAAQFTHYETQSTERGWQADLLSNTQRLRLLIKHRPTHWLNDTFLPAERAKLLQQTNMLWLNAMACAYESAALTARSLVLGDTASFAQEDNRVAVKQILDMLFDLRQLARNRANEVGGVSAR